MAEHHENEPLLAGNASQANEDEYVATKDALSASAYFKRTTKALSITISLLSSLIFVLFIGLAITLHKAPFPYWQTGQTINAAIKIGVCVCLSLYLFLQLYKADLLMHTGYPSFHFHNT